MMGQAAGQGRRPPGSPPEECEEVGSGPTLLRRQDRGRSYLTAAKKSQLLSSPDTGFLRALEIGLPLARPTISRSTSSPATSRICRTASSNPCSSTRRSTLWHNTYPAPAPAPASRPCRSLSTEPRGKRPRSKHRELPAADDGSFLFSRSM